MGSSNGFIVLSHPRSGTSYLVHGVLSSHPGVICFGELFNSTDHTKRIIRDYGLEDFDNKIYINSRRFKEPLKFLREFRKKIDREKLIGFKLFPEQLFDYDIVSLAEQWPIIFLRRMNMAQSAISYEIARRTGQWNKTQAEIVEPFEANINRMIRFINKYNYYLNNYEKFLEVNNIKHLSLTYENLFTRNSLDKITDFLGIDEFPETFDFKDSKLNDKARYVALIKNIEEVNERMTEKGFGSLV